jgi:hypothetical protein
LAPPSLGPLELLPGPKSGSAIATEGNARQRVVIRAAVLRTAYSFVYGPVVCHEVYDVLQRTG